MRKKRNNSDNQFASVLQFLSSSECINLRLPNSPTSLLRSSPSLLIGFLLLSKISFAADNIIQFPGAKQPIKCEAVVSQESQVIPMKPADPEADKKISTSRLKEEGKKMLSAADQSYGQYLRSQREQFELTTYKVTFEAFEAWDSYRTYSTRAKNTKFGLMEALNAKSSPAWLDSGASTRLVFGQFWRNGLKFDWARQSNSVGRITLIANDSPGVFMTDVFKNGLGFGKTNYRMQDFIGFSTADNRVVLENVSTLPENEWPQSKFLEVMKEQRPNITYFNENLSNRQMSSSLKEVEGTVDVITDYLGSSSFENNFGTVLSRYNSFLREGGHLFLAIPVRKVYRDHPPVDLVNFYINKGVNQKMIEGDEFFDRIPGFSLINSYISRGALSSDVNASLESTLVRKYLDNSQYRGEYDVLVVILKKTASTGDTIESAIQDDRRSDESVFRRIVIDPIMRVK